MSDRDVKSRLISQIDQFIEDRMIHAHNLIIEYAYSKIKDGDVILTFSNYHAVERLLLRAHQYNRKFKVVVVDSNPRKDGRTLLATCLQQV